MGGVTRPPERLSPNSRIRGGSIKNAFYRPRGTEHILVLKIVKFKQKNSFFTGGRYKMQCGGDALDKECIPEILCLTDVTLDLYLPPIHWI